MERGMEDFKDLLATEYKGELAYDALIGPMLTWKIGGKSSVAAFPSCESELLALLRLAKESGIPSYIIGRGSNILFGDRDFKGLVIYLGRNFKNWSCEPGPGGSTLLRAQSGISLSRLGAIARERSLTGLENLTFIPGSLGGALITNAEAHKSSIGSLVRSVRVLDGEELRTLSREDCGFAYRTSVFEQKPELVILEAELMLETGDPAAIEEKTREAGLFRSSQPKGPSAGSVFKNPPGNPAGMLIDRTGLKGRSHGGAVISDLHANFILNRGNARAEDVLRLIELAREEVHRKYGVNLELEIKLFNV